MQSSSSLSALASCRGMRGAASMRLFVSAIAVATALSSASYCPPKNFAPQEGINLNTYLSGSWFVQQRMKGVSYTSQLQNSCVQMDYVPVDRSNFWGFDYTLDIRSRDDRFPHVESHSKRMCTEIEDAREGKIRTGLCWLPTFLASSYSVISHNEPEGYALITSGSPTLEAGDGLCTFSRVSLSGRGLWLLTRAQARNETLLNKVHEVARGKGLSLSSIIEDIDQEHC